MADQNYWVRTEHGRTWGPFTLDKLERLRGQLTEKAEASTDGQTWKPGTSFPELKDLLSPARKIEKMVAPPSSNPPRISKAIAEAFGIKPESPAPEPEPAAKKAPKKPHKAVDQPAPVQDKPLELTESGDLAESSPVRLYGLAALTSASGCLKLELEKGRKLQITFRRGTPEHLSTDDPDQSLVRWLQQKGVVPAASAAKVEEQAQKTGQDVLSVLFQLQLIPPADAHKLLGDYSNYLLDRAFLTWRGKFTFEKDAPPPPGAFPLGSKWTLLAESVRRLEMPLLRARLGKRLPRPVVRSGGLHIGRLEELALNAQETRIYASIDGTRTGEELVKAGDAGVTLRLLYLLTELGHLGFAEVLEADEEDTDPELQPVKVTPAETAKAPEKKPQRELPKSAREVGREPARAQKGEVPKVSKPPPVMQSAPPVLKSGASPTPQPPVKAAAAPPPKITRPPPTWANSPPGESPLMQEQRLAGLLEQLEKADHFEALGMEKKTATAAEAKRNFFVLAKELHPDTVADPAQASLRQVKERLFARINAAAQVLGDDKKRKEYEEELEGKKGSVEVARIFAAEENFQRAEIMIKARKYQEGLDLLEKAISLNDKEAEFYAWRGYAKFLISSDRKTAYEECAEDCRKAIRMQDMCLPAHLFLGHMSKVVGDTKLATKCYHKVLELDPKHVEAQRELRVMGKK